MKPDFPLEIRSNFQSFNALTRVYAQLKRSSGPTCEIDMTKVTWFDANMCANFGALLCSLNASGKRINLDKPSSYKVREIFNKNGFNRFLSAFGYHEQDHVDTFGTTIRFEKLAREGINLFKDYVRTHFVGKGMPKMSAALSSEFRESLFEIFDNAAVHSMTQLGIFVCGQYFPKKDCLDFQISDLGIGIKDNVNTKMNMSLSPVEAIEWAVDKANTTKMRGDGKPGGHGLKLLRDFIRLNRGRVVIVSDAGYWEQSPQGEVVTRMLDYPFPGTTVMIEINTADQNSCVLSSEDEMLDPNDVL